ncbi:MAG: hypothetical protein EHM58_10330 [Ignavibacteriae bacterium]|nr:MAG: hypothetical protein EHM58_10330 [Ignavibacteriota bacterium]
MKNKKYTIYLFFILFQLIFIYDVTNTQVIKVVKDSEGYGWYLADYILPDAIIEYRINDSEKRCVNGGEMDARDYYTVNLLPTKILRGKYAIVLYTKPYKIIFRTAFEIR